MKPMAVRGESVLDIRKSEHVAGSGEAIALCPHCKALQTIWINDGTLMPFAPDCLRQEHILQPDPASYVQTAASRGQAKRPDRGTRNRREQRIADLERADGGINSRHVRARSCSSMNTH